MVSRVIALVLLMATVAFGQNFETYQRNDPRSKQIVDRAEQCRRDIAVAWFGKELPAWNERCVIVWQEDASRGSGATTYNEGRNSPTNMRMEVQGSWNRIINDVIPHEVLHLVIRHQLGFTPPRWMNEGAASTAESDDSITLLENSLRRYLVQNRVPTLDRTIAFREYPSDAIVFYAQGVSVARFLIGKYGVDRFMQLARTHRSTRDWSHSFQSVYGYNSIQAVQDDWLGWVKLGSPDQVAQVDQTPQTLLKPIPRGQAPYRPVATTTVAQQCDNGMCLTTPIRRGQIVRAPIVSTPSVQCPPGPQGPKGEPGEPGPPGKDGTVTSEQLAAIAAAITEQLRNDPSLRGDVGPAGPAASPADLDAAVSRYFQSNPNTISLSLIDGDGKVLDTDTVELGGELKLQFIERK